MKDEIPVVELFRVIGDGLMPLGEAFTEDEMEAVLSRMHGVKVISLKTKSTVYQWNGEKYAWVLA